MPWFRAFAFGHDAQRVDQDLVRCGGRDGRPDRDVRDDATRTAIAIGPEDAGLRKADLEPGGGQLELLGGAVSGATADFG